MLGDLRRTIGIKGGKLMEKDFKYVIDGSPIDYFYTTLSKEDLIQAYRNEYCCSGEFVENLNANYDFIVSTVERLGHEKPHTVRYFSIPRYGWCDMELCAVAKIDNNGTTFMFTNNREFAQFISENSGYSFDVETLI